MTGTADTERGLDLAIIDRTVERLNDGNLVWFAVGASAPLQLAATSTVDPVKLGARLARSDRDASFCLVDRRDPRSPVLYLWRGILSIHDWFFAGRGDGRTIVSDDFRSALAGLPVSERHPGENAVVQHYLYRTVYGTDTYVERIHRVGAGDQVTIDIANGASSTVIIDRIASESDLVEPERYVSAIEDALEAEMADLRSIPDLRLAFSGGVDSTLLATFMDSDRRLLTVVPDTAEFAVETAYARESAGLVGMSIDEITVSERSYVDLLEATIDDTARPPVHDVMPFLATAYRTDHGGTFIIGEGADGMFAAGGRAVKLGKYFRQRHLRAATLGAMRLAPQGFRARIRSGIVSGGHLSADPESAEGHAAAFAIYGDPRFIRDIAGPERIESVLLSGLAFVMDRVELVKPSDPFLRQIEFRQWRSFFNDHLQIDGDVARAHGTSVIAPFLRSRTVSALTSIPIADRYHKGFTGKWLLKSLLAERLPTYPVGQRKRYTALPFTRFCTDGPLVGIWDRYTPPSLFSGEARHDLIASKMDEAVLWNAIAWAIWDERVLRNPALTPHPSTECLSIDVSSTR
jgi:asparagine synthetase B (glutamine-hydrolysing)